MYFSQKGFSKVREGDSAIVLLAPIYETNGKETVLEPAPCDAADGLEWRGIDLRVTDRVEKTDVDGIFTVHRKLENTGRYRRVFKFICETKDLFPAAKYTIPCVSYDGNERSLGDEPHGWEKDGECWKFGGDRSGICAATVTETKDVCAAMFACAEGRFNQDCASAFIRDRDGCFFHRIYYPVTEAPYSYIGHDETAPRYDTYLIVEPDSSVELAFHVFVGTPIYENFGTASLYVAVSKLIPFDHVPDLNVEEAYRTSLAFSEHMLCDVPGGKMFRNIMLPDLKDPEGYGFHFPVYEAGWSGQNFSQARLFINEYVKRGGDRKYLDAGLACLDLWMQTQEENGLFPINYVRFMNKNYAPADICNIGWAACECFAAYRLTKEIGIDRTSYLRFAERICDFFERVFNEEDGFGLSYNIKEGTKAQSGGSIGGFACMALTEGARTTGNARYVALAERAMDFYFERDINNFICTAGAIDCTCIDKETAYPFVRAALDLYDLTGNEKYITYAKKAGYYFLSYTFMYDVICPEGCDFDTYGYYTSGATSVSTQHPALDPWGEVIVCEYIRIYRLTGEEVWLDFAKRMWANALCCIATDENVRWHGRKRPYGTQSEAYFPSRWAREKYYRNVEKRGSINHLFACWCAAYRMLCLDRMKEVYGESDYSILGE